MMGEREAVIFQAGQAARVCWARPAGPYHQIALGLA
jgi:hypothetical protein